MNIKIGRFAVCFWWYAANPWTARWAWGVHKWHWRGETSWRHGTAYLGKLKIMW